MQGAKKQGIIMDHFMGVNQIIDEVKAPLNVVLESYGGIYDEKGVFSRLPGKLLYNSSSVGGRVISLQQIVFQDATHLVIHQSTGMFAVSDLSELESGTAVDVVNPLTDAVFF